LERKKIKMVPVVKSLAFLNSNGSSTRYFHFLPKHVADIKLPLCVIQERRDTGFVQSTELPE